ncbi:MAG: DUF4172 domain-containing protein [Chlamydiae bacterium]|nr:DUF4172 domain-containing protein [Chlamydiota bacterium]
MPWNWELPDWPNFTSEVQLIAEREKQFLLAVGSSLATFKHIGESRCQQYIVEMLSTEGMESSKIEGEILDRKSLQSSIKRHFGIQTELKKESQKEASIAMLLCSVYETFDNPLTHEMLFAWHSTLFKDNPRIEDCGRYRTHKEPMQIVSSRYGAEKVFFQAPPSDRVRGEMNKFIDWFNASKENGSILRRAAIAHVYFESIHPFEDGNGRIGRAIVEKILSQGVDRPVVIAISKVLEKRKKEYYAALEKCNKTLDVGHWTLFFTEVIIEAQKESLALLYFIIDKATMLSALQGQLNPRQEKVLLRIFAEGLEGFQGGLSAENYISITKTSRATATRDLAELVEMGALIKIGVLRHTRYWLNLKVNP